MKIDVLVFASLPDGSLEGRCLRIRENRDHMQKVQRRYVFDKNP
jgi:hypothetical protein